MIKVYEIKDNGFIGESKEIDPKEGVGSNWTYTAPPDSGVYKWENGQWVEGVEPDPIVMGPDIEGMSNSIRQQRNKLLAESDWTQVKDISDSISTTYAIYRQKLRDLPEQNEFPFSVTWPEV